MAKSITRNGKKYNLNYAVKFVDGEPIPDENAEITESDIDEYESAEEEEAALRELEQEAAQ